MTTNRQNSTDKRHANNQSSHGTENRGLGSPNMSEETKHRIQSAGGKASHGGNDISNKNRKDN